MLSLQPLEKRVCYYTPSILLTSNAEPKRPDLSSQADSSASVVASVALDNSASKRKHVIGQRDLLSSRRDSCNVWLRDTRRRAVKGCWGSSKEDGTFDRIGALVTPYINS